MRQGTDCDSLDGWPELENRLKGLLSTSSPLEKQDLFYKFVFEYPMILLDTEVSEVTACIQFGLHDRDNLSITIQAIKAGVAILQTDDRAVQMTDLMPSILDVSAIRPMKTGSDVVRAGVPILGRTEPTSYASQSILRFHGDLQQSSRRRLALALLASTSAVHHLPALTLVWPGRAKAGSGDPRQHRRDVPKSG